MFVVIGGGAVDIGGPGYALFAGGWTGSVTSAITQKYIFANGSLGAGGNLSQARSRAAGAANTTYAAFMAGTTSNLDLGKVSTTDRYTWASETSAGSTATGNPARFGGGGSSSETKGYLFGGQAVFAQQLWDEYTFATEGYVWGTNLSYITNNPGAVGPSTHAIIGGGYSDPAYIQTSMKFTYATKVTIAGTNLGLARQLPGAAGTPTIGVFAGGEASGNRDYTDIYTYSGDSVAVGAVLPVAAISRQGAGNAFIGVFDDWNGGTQVYTFALAGWVAGNNLTYPYNGMGAASSSPGHL